MNTANISITNYTVYKLSVKDMVKLIGKLKRVLPDWLSDEIKDLCEFVRQCQTYTPDGLPTHSYYGSLDPQICKHLHTFIWYKHAHPYISARMRFRQDEDEDDVSEYVFSYSIDKKSFSISMDFDTSDITRALVPHLPTWGTFTCTKTYTCTYEELTTHLSKKGDTPDE